MKKKLKNLCKVVLLSTAVSLPGTIVGVNIGSAIAEWQNIKETEQKYGQQMAEQYIELSSKASENLPWPTKVFDIVTKLVLDNYKK